MSRWSDEEAAVHEITASFNGYERREWMIYGSRHQACPKCSEPANTACVDLNKRRRGIEEPVKNPHSERIDYQRILQGLTERGYSVPPAEPDPFDDPIETMPEWARA